jgi:N-acyl-phosphatidylethanolamine-hydrolysing phospholipase D
LKWVAQRFVKGLAGRLPPEPDPSVFPRAEPAIERPRADPSRLVVTWVGHSTYLLQIGGLNVLTDPMWGNRASPFSFAGPRRWVPPGLPLDALPPIDVVLQSHNHYDHLDSSSVEQIASGHPHAQWYVPLGLAPLVKSYGVGLVAELDWWQETVHAGLAIACTPARHFSARGLRDRDATLWCGWSVRSGSHCVFFAGDTGLHPEFRRIAERFGPFDVSMLPIGAYEPRWFMRPVHMAPDETVEAYREIRTVAPPNHRSMMAAMHWGTFKLTEEAMDEPPRRTRAEWARADLPVSELWIPAHGESRTIP